MVTAAAGGTGSKLARWHSFVRANDPIDVVGPRPNGSLVLAVLTGLATLSQRGIVKPYATAYHGQGGEPYIALARRRCFGTGVVYALRPFAPQGVLSIAPGRKARTFARLRGAGLANGIAFDTTGHFDGRLLVTVSGNGRTTVESIGCHGDVRTITRTAPTVEGGIAVAPASFGPFGGDLIAPDELTGRIWAITPKGRTRLVATSDLPVGQDTGVESLGFLPTGGGAYRVFMADSAMPGNRFAGNDEVLEVGSGALRAAGVRGGDLLAATEGGALVDAISCGSLRCRVHQVAAGPAAAHGEGHIAVVLVSAGR